VATANSQLFFITAPTQRVKWCCNRTDRKCFTLHREGRVTGCSVQYAHCSLYSHALVTPIRKSAVYRAPFP